MRIPKAKISSLAETLGIQPHVIYAVETVEGYAIALADHWVLGFGDNWSVYEWKNILSGHWDKEELSLSWELIDGSVGTVKLPEPKDMPLVFRERINASILVQRSLDIIPDDVMTADEAAFGKVLIAGRRNPHAEGEIIWTAQAIGRTNLDDENVQRFIVEQTRVLAEELGVTQPDLLTGAFLVK